VLSYPSGIVALSSADIWGVGSFSASGRSRTLVQKWNGSRWRVVPTPLITTPGGVTLSSQLSAIDAVGPGELWAVGESQAYHTAMLVDRYGDPFCYDGIDNDGDGAIDYRADPGCTSAT